MWRHKLKILQEPGYEKQHRRFVPAYRPRLNLGVGYADSEKREDLTRVPKPLSVGTSGKSESQLISCWASGVENSAGSEAGSLCWE